MGFYTTSKKKPEWLCDSTTQSLNVVSAWFRPLVTFDMITTYSANKQTNKQYKQRNIKTNKRVQKNKQATGYVVEVKQIEV